MKKIIIVAILILVFSGLTFNTVKKMGSKEEEEIKKIAKKYGRKMAEDVEKIYRLETNHFTSRAYKATFAPGMQATAEKFPYGWTSFRPLWADPPLKPTGLITFNDNATGEPIRFIRFPSLGAAMESLVHFLKTRTLAEWNSKNEHAQNAYLGKLSQITPKITNALT